jgi:hypothetical protein
MIEKAYLRGTQTKNTKCYLSVRDIQKIYISWKCIQNKFKREKYVYYKYGRQLEVISTEYQLSVDWGFGQTIIDTVAYREKHWNKWYY